MAIRYDKKFQAEIRSTIRKYNRKVRRLKGRTDVYVPETVTKTLLAEMKAKSTTRKDLRRQLKVLSRFTARGGEKFININNKEIPKSLYESAKILTRTLSRKINTELTELKTNKPSVLGKVQDVTFAEMADRRYLNLEAKQLRIKTGTEIKNLNVGELQTYINFLTSNLRTTDFGRWKNNYLDILTDTAYTYGVPHSQVHKLRERLSDLTVSDFNDLFNRDKALQQIVYYYHSVEDIGIDLAYEYSANDVQQLFDALEENLDIMLRG